MSTKTLIVAGFFVTFPFLVLLSLYNQAVARAATVNYFWHASCHYLLGDTVLRRTLQRSWVRP